VGETLPSADTNGQFSPSPRGLWRVSSGVHQTWAGLVASRMAMLLVLTCLSFSVLISCCPWLRVEP